MPTDKQVEGDKAMDNQVKEICTCCGHDKSIHVMDYEKEGTAFCTDPDCECSCFTSTKLEDSHPSSQSLKRISDKKIKEVFADTELDKYPYLESVHRILDAQLAADQPVVAELEKQIARLKQENVVLQDCLGDASKELPLKAQLQPVEGEVEKLCCKHCGELALLNKDGICEVCYPMLDTIIVDDWEVDYSKTKEQFSKLSALIQSRKGKVAGEITLDRMFLRLEQIDHIMKDNPEIKFKVINQEARYSPESER